MKYALLIYDDPSNAPLPDTPEAQEDFGAWMRVSEEMGPVTAGGEALQPKETATTVRAGGNGEPVLTDGPFAETKEVLGGFYIIDVPSQEEAVEWAKRLPPVPGTKCEIRRVASIDEFPQDNEWVARERAWREQTGQL